MIKQRVATLSALWAVAAAKTKDTATPPMGWNSYNHYSCSPTEQIMKENAQGLIDTGLASLGYNCVTTDCGWPTSERDAEGRLQWDPELFPSGGPALGEYIHGLGLKFGVYSGGGYYQCGSEDLLASLGYEDIDAETFAAWGADALKYDNCYAVSPDVMVDYDSPDAVSPDRFQDMADAINNTDRDMMYEVCQWGTGTDIGLWAPPMSNTWRMSNDISNDWKSIWRITNEVVPYAEYTGPGAFPDMDMLIVGLDVLSETEERFHFSMWAINKSPLVIGCPTTSDGGTPESSLAILSNTEVIAINQDSLAKSASLVRRYTEAEWDLWSGPLADGKVVVALANWNGEGQTVSVNLTEALGIESATARDVWAASDVGETSDVYTAELTGHELQLLVLSDIVASDFELSSAGYYPAKEATLAGSAAVVDCTSTQCLPTNAKVGTIGPSTSDASVTFDSVQASSSGRKLLGVDFINYDIALETAWENGSNSRNMSIAVNGGTATRWAFPISGGNWFDTGRLEVEVDGFNEGDNTVVFTASVEGGEYAPDLVGFELFEY